jgi:hypothetical protein
VFLVFRKDETSMVVQNFIKLARRFLSERRNSRHLVTGTSTSGSERTARSLPDASK